MMACNSPCLAARRTTSGEKRKSSQISATVYHSLCRSSSIVSSCANWMSNATAIVGLLLETARAASPPVQHSALRRVFRLARPGGREEANSQDALAITLLGPVALARQQQIA